MTNYEFRFRQDGDDEDMVYQLWEVPEPFVRAVRTALMAQSELSNVRVVELVSQGAAPDMTRQWPNWHGRPCKPGCNCRRHVKTPEHKARIGISVSLTTQAKKRARG